MLTAALTVFERYPSICFTCNFDIKFSSESSNPQFPETARSLLQDSAQCFICAPSWMASVTTLRGYGDTPLLERNNLALAALLAGDAGRAGSHRRGKPPRGGQGKRPPEGGPVPGGI